MPGVPEAVSGASWGGLVEAIRRAAGVAVQRRGQASGFGDTAGAVIARSSAAQGQLPKSSDKGRQSATGRTGARGGGGDGDAQ